jgi:hypothetical protein
MIPIRRLQDSMTDPLQNKTEQEAVAFFGFQDQDFSHIPLRMRAPLRRDVIF